MPNEAWVIKEKYRSQESPIGFEKIWDSPTIQKFYKEKNPETTKLKKLVRAGIPDEIRGNVYSKLLKIDKLEDYEKNYEAGLVRTYGVRIPQNPVVPTFGGRPHRDDSALNAAGSNIVEHVLCILCNDFPNLEYCPFLPPLASLLAHHLRSPDELLGAMVSVVKSSLNKAPGQDKWTYLPTFSVIIRKDHRLMQTSFENFLQKKNSKVSKKIQEIISTEERLTERWMTDFFIPILPQELIWRILDCFILEGYKSLFRFAISLIELQQKKILMSNTKADLESCFLKTVFSEISIDKTCSIAGTYSISEKYASELTKNKIISIEDIHESSLKYQRGLPKLKDYSKVLIEMHWMVLWSWIPHRYRVDEVELIFTTSDNGYNIGTMYEMTKHKKHMILVVETMEGQIFGAFISGGWGIEENMQRGQLYCGDGETFLFTIEPYGKLYPWVAANNSDVEVTKDNSLFILATKNDLSIGGGGG
ncbi:hypothetical protein HK099_006404 [Clydaea vesicula]|uniref:TLDc domain-containing protein n=1 Tax=Clydaea vesicula TaxID=447962 RepID=A0AAD5U9P2_9FUNG|nr:hypothetical protein HK099_006404 [Clydaea vesicula]